MDELGLEASTFLREFQDQPEEIRRIFLYAICQTMVQAGLLEFLGAFATPGYGTTILYKNSDTQEIIEILRPEMSVEEEQAMRAHIGELLQESARSAV